MKWGYNDGKANGKRTASDELEEEAKLLLERQKVETDYNKAKEKLEITEQTIKEMNKWLNDNKHNDELSLEWDIMFNTIQEYGKMEKRLKQKCDSYEKRYNVLNDRYLAKQKENMNSDTIRGANSRRPW